LGSELGARGYGNGKVCLRVLALLTEAFGGYGGIAQYNRDLLLALSQSSHVHEVLALPRFGRAALGETPEKIKQLAPASSKVSYVLSAFRIAIRCEPADLIFCGHINAAPLCMVLGRFLRVPVWLQTHGIDVFERPALPARYAAERAALITTVSRYTRKRLLRWVNADANRVRVLPNTVRPMFRPGPASAQTLSRFALPQEKLILTVSRISKAEQYKGHASVIKALPALRQIHPDAIYAIAGDGDGRPALEDLVSRLGLQSHVRFLGRVSDEEVLALYRSAQIFIMPSLREGFGIVFVEAAATGLPVIGGNRDGSLDALADGNIGRALDPESQDEIVSALAKALDSPCRAGPEKVERFSFSHFADHVDELVKNIGR
jgi:phosphatidyl-myo-inositol dimannoside synthase